MALSQIVKITCNACGKIAIEESRVKLGKTTIIRLACGHLLNSESLSAGDVYHTIVSTDGCSPREYQIDAIKFAEESDARCIIADEPGLGKYQDIDSLIVTPTGFKRIGDASIGDAIINSDGYTSHITKVYPQGIKSVYEVIFSDGSKCNSGLDHLWAVNTSTRIQRDNPYKVKTLQTIMDEGLVVGGKLRHRIPITESINFDAQELRIQPYMLGLLLGDGGLTRDYEITFSSADEELVESLDIMLAKFGCELKHRDRYDYAVRGSSVIIQRIFDDLGLRNKKSSEKFIPDIYKFNTVANRLDILRGVMDTDGSISKIGITEFVSTSKMLCDDIKFIVQSLGGVAYYSTKKTHYTYKGEYKNGLLTHRLVINMVHNPFSLKRKSSIWKPNSKYSPIRGIKEINYIGEKECVCITTDAANHLYLTNECIVTHNTWESLSLLRLHPEKLLPAVIVCPTTVKLQWMWEIHRICGNGKEFLTQVIQSGKEKAMPGFKIYIITYDMLKKDDVFAYVPEIKTIIIDECQRIKNHLSDRAKAVQKIAKKVSHIIPMSGTPIKNNAGEYFTVLNLVAPTRFPQWQRFVDTYCDSYDSGWGTKVGGLKNAERFHEDTKDIIIRRTKSEVLRDLPPIDRKFYHVELDKKLNKAYAQALEELDELLYSEENEFAKSTATITIMSKLRHITGISKTAECIDFAEEFLGGSERKLVIFVHHQDVAMILMNALKSKCEELKLSEPLHMHSGLDGNARQNLVTRFKDSPESRIMVASTLASGEGINLQFCSDAVILERQWNPANEEQAEGRFHRFGQINPVSITYMIASGTIDEYFTELVEIKRSIVSTALDKKEIEWNQQGLMKELASLLVTRGRERWKL